MKRTTNKVAHILVNDPSLTAWGWAVVSGSGKVVDCGAIRTQPSHKKLRIRKGDDRVRRISELNNRLLELIQEYNIKYLISELPHGSQTASAAVMIGITAGIMQTIGDCLDIPVEWYSEGDAKKAISGKQSVSKSNMIELIREEYDPEFTGVKWKDEAIADALAIYHVAMKHSTILQILRTGIL